MSTKTEAPQEKPKPKEQEVPKKEQEVPKKEPDSVNPLLRKGEDKNHNHNSFGGSWSWTGEDDEGAYGRLTPELKKVVDGLVTARGELLLGYKAELGGAQSGQPLSGAALDALQQDYTKKTRPLYKQAAEIIEAHKKQNESESAESVRGTPFGLHYWRFGGGGNDIALDFVRAYKDESFEWNKEHGAALRGMHMGAINKVLREQEKRSGVVRESTQLSPDVKDVPGLFSDLLSKNPGIAIADVHVYDDAFNLVSDNMETLKKSNVDTIYIELSPDHAKKFTDLTPDQLRTLKKDKKLGDLTIRSSDENAGAYGQLRSDDIFGSLVSMLIKAKEHGIEVKGMDEKVVNSGMMPGWRRIGVTNAVWPDNVRAHRETLPEPQQKSGRFVMIGGLAHFAVNGRVDEALGIPTVALSQGEKDREPLIERSGKVSSPDFFVPGGADYVDMQKLLKAERLTAAGTKLRRVGDGLPSFLSVPVIMASQKAKEQARQYRIELWEEMNIKEGDPPPAIHPGDPQFTLPPPFPRFQPGKKDESNAKERASDVVPSIPTNRGQTIQGGKDVDPNDLTPPNGLPSKPIGKPPIGIS